jgi:hypothetical protein
LAIVCCRLEVDAIGWHPFPTNGERRRATGFAS